MKFARIVCLAAAPFLLMAADQKPKKPAARKPAAESGLPAGAKQIEPGTYRYTDAKGKTWIYKQLPFGFSRYEEKTGEALREQAKKNDESIPDGMTATEDGDNIKFERPGAMGPYRWTRNKNDLTPLEKRVWERESQKKAGNASGRE